MGSFTRKSEFWKAENIDKPLSSNDNFHVTSDPHLSHLREFWKNNYAHVILTAEADILPTDANKLLNDYGLVGRELIPQDVFAFYGNQMLTTEMDMPQSLKSNLARRQKEQSENRASDLLSNSLLI